MRLLVKAINAGREMLACVRFNGSGYGIAA